MEGGCKRRGRRRRMCTRTCAVLERGGATVVSSTTREDSDVTDAAGERGDVSTRSAAVRSVYHVDRTGSGWEKKQSPLCQIRCLGWLEISPLRGPDSACRGDLARFHPNTRLPKRGLRGGREWNTGSRVRDLFIRSKHDFNHWIDDRWSIIAGLVGLERA
jgi:hypothetical protein